MEGAGGGGGGEDGGGAAEGRGPGWEREGGERGGGVVEREEAEVRGGGGGRVVDRGREEAAGGGGGREPADDVDGEGEQAAAEGGRVGHFCCSEGLGRWCRPGSALPPAAELGFTGGGATNGDGE